MVQSANAFQLDSQIAPAELPRPQSERRAVLRVLPAPAPLAAPATLAQPRVRLNSTFVTILVALVLLALAAFTYIWLVNSTMRQTVVTGQLRNEISQSRSLGHDLESQYSALANPQNIQQQARALAMVPDNSPEYLYLESSSATADAPADNGSPAPASPDTSSMVSTIVVEPE